MDRTDIGVGAGGGHSSPPHIFVLLSSAYPFDSERTRALGDVLTAFDRSLGNGVCIRRVHSGDEEKLVDEVRSGKWTEPHRKLIAPISLLFLNTGLSDFNSATDPWQLIDLHAYAPQDDGKLAFKPLNHLFSYLQAKLTAGRKVVDAVQDYRLDFNRGLFREVGLEASINLLIFKLTWKLPRGGKRRVGG